MFRTIINTLAATITGSHNLRTVETDFYGFLRANPDTIAKPYADFGIFVFRIVNIMEKPAVFIPLIQEPLFKIRVS